MLVSESAPPPIPGWGGAYWERCEDPFHKNAFPEHLKHAGKSGPQRNGWMLIDWCENPIGWIADGEAFPDAHKQEFEFRQSPFGHLAAYPKAV